MRFRAAILLLILWRAASAGSIHLKTRDIDTSVTPANETEAASRLRASRLHVMAEFPEGWDEGTVALLRSREIAVVSVIGTHALTLSAPDKHALHKAGIGWWDQIGVRDKLSPEFVRREAMGYGAIVAFHEDVTSADMDAVMRANGMVPERVSGLLPSHRLIRASREALEKLAGWDEVAYIFPAPPHLPEWNAKPCAGALVGHLAVAQFVPEGPGWPVHSPAGLSLNYVFTTLPGSVPASQAQSEVLRGMHQWALVTNVHFNQGINAAGAMTIAIEWGTSVNNDPTPFDPAGSILAHTYYPAPPNPEPIAGDMHFNPAEPWHVGSDTDIYTVALHELGHALGLGHTDNPGDVMYPYYHFGSELSVNDIAGVQAFYGVAGQPSPVLSGGNPGGAGNPVAPASPIALSILSPANGSHTAAQTVSISGTLLSASGLAAVMWRSGTQTGMCSGSSDWSASAIPLRPGVNLITITATDAPQQATSAVVRILRTGGP